MVWVSVYPSIKGSEKGYFEKRFNRICNIKLRMRIDLTKTTLEYNVWLLCCFW